MSFPPVLKKTTREPEASRRAKYFLLMVPEGENRTKKQGKAEVEV